MAEIRVTPGGGMEAIAHGGSWESVPKAAKEEIERLRGALERIQIPMAFYVATSRVDPEAYARMVYAAAVLEGQSLPDADNFAETKTIARYAQRGAV